MAGRLRRDYGGSTVVDLAKWKRQQAKLKLSRGRGQGGRSDAEVTKIVQAQQSRCWANRQG